MTTALALALAIVAVAFVLYPLIAGAEAGATPPSREVDEVGPQRRMVLRTLEELEYDFHAGKLSQADYLAVKRWVQAGSGTGGRHGDTGS